MPVPGFVLKTFLGEFGDVLALSSIKADSSKLIDSGYEFRFEDLEECFRHLLGKRKTEEGKKTKDKEEGIKKKETGKGKGNN